MNNTLSAPAPTAAATWWWHPKPGVVAVPGLGMESAAAGTWWWHPKPVAADTIA